MTDSTRKTPADPATLAEYEERAARNHRISGGGFDVQIAMPCPFCAAADWMVSRVAEFTAAMESGPYTCGECERSAGFEIERTPDSVSFEVVQTGGADPPDYLPPLRRFP